MKVSAEGFGALARPPGWKYERWNGRLRLEPDWRFETARWAGPLPQRVFASGVRVGRTTSAADAVAVADAAFESGPDFFRFPLGVRRQRLAAAVHDAMDLEPAWIRAAHRMAWSPDGEPVGVILARETARGALIETLAVVPGLWRRGVATALLRSALGALGDREVWSSWLVANRESRAWHVHSGFEIVPTSVSARSELTACLWRGLPPGAAADARAALAEQEERERAGDLPDPFALVRPLHRRPRR